MVWGSTNCNDRGVVLLEFLEVIDITKVFFGFLESLRKWEVSFEPSL
jgi:hypothetical protein